MSDDQVNESQDFWSRRRAGVQAESHAEQVSVDAEVHAEQQAVLAEKTDVELLDELGLPDPDTMKMGDDFSVFMSKAIPDRLRRRALRTLWRSNPVLANVDMLVDYGEDFTDSAMVVENMQTAYQVGKGMLKHVEEMARQAEERENPSDPLVEEDVEEDDILLAAVKDVEEQDAPALEELVIEAEDAEIHQSPPPRRMKFRAEAVNA